jgi:DNA repair photolyase
MKAIYEPRGKAREYSPLACNLYKGCSHGCVYCYAPSATYTDKEKFHSEVYPRNGILNAVEKDAASLEGDNRDILLCFTTDPYQPIEEKMKITRQALRSFARHGLSCQILTKGGLLATRDFDLLSQNPNNKFSVTLTTDDPEESKEWEPNASLPADRIESLRLAHEFGISTWVSFEPVINPDAVYRLIDQTHEFVDLYKVGKMNYHPHAKTIDWVAFRSFVIRCLSKYSKKYYLKRDLVAAR